VQREVGKTERKHHQGKGDQEYDAIVRAAPEEQEAKGSIAELKEQAGQEHTDGIEVERKTPCLKYLHIV